MGRCRFGKKRRKREELELDIEEGLGIARGAKVDLAGVPVFYLPWMQFPIDDRRRTGFLWPDIGSDTRGGLDLSVPVYFNLAPNYDLLYSPRFIQERGLNHEVKGRYLNPLVGACLLVNVLPFSRKFCGVR